MRPDNYGELRRRHAEALAAFISDAASIPAARWDEPRSEGKWSPAQVAEHLRLTYLTVGCELAGETGFRVRLGRLRRGVLRLFVLPRILRTGRFPTGAPATREVRPASGILDRTVTIEGLRAAAETFDRAFDRRRLEPGATFTHPFFGQLAPLRGYELMVAHTRHHHEQIRGSLLHRDVEPHDPPSERRAP